MRTVAQPHLRSLPEFGDVVFAVDVYSIDIAHGAGRSGHEARGGSVEELELRVQVSHRVSSAYTLAQWPFHQLVVFLILSLLLDVDGVGKLLEECHSL